ncbi:sigma-70 family RNA polymerase sigma factor [Streptomyces sp. HSW2009]|uniref:RNA polymerase sigma factor n=1 Tax=Streptomyces sp. HSW2009 TaxID=3142890 RepID=UPI0032F099CE
MVEPQLTHESLTRIHENEHASLTRFLLLQGASWPEAQDSVQEAFTHLWQQREAPRHPRAWLRTVARRAWLKRPVREQPDADPGQAAQPTRVADWYTPLEAIELSDEQRRVIALLTALPPRQRAAMAWHLDGFSTAEIAAETGMTPAAVYQNLKRAREALRTALNHVQGSQGAGE